MIEQPPASRAIVRVLVATVAGGELPTPRW
jgi:hypothetical protein